jgi:hypothetical protein
MPDITQTFAIDEKYTIVAEVAPGTPETSDVLKGAIIGTAVAPNIRVVTKYIKEVQQPKTISVPRYVRETGRALAPIESLKTPKQILDGYYTLMKPVTITGVKVDSMLVKGESILPVQLKTIKQKGDIKGLSGESIGLKAVATATTKPPIKGQEFFTMKEALAPRKEGRMTYKQLERQSSIVERLKEKKPKKVLGVQRAQIFKDAEQISVERRIQTQKKELRKDLKSQVLINSSMSKMIEQKESQVIALKKQVSDLNSRYDGARKEIRTIKTDINRNYVTKAYHQKTVARLQMTLQGYAERMTGISARQGQFAPGADVGELTRARRGQQKQAMNQLAERMEMERRQSSLGSMFNKMGMKARRTG